MKFNVDDFKFQALFKDLKNGETFYYEPSGVVWMKLCENTHFHNQAVALDDGMVCEFDDNDLVVKVNIKCEVTISPIKTLDN